MKAVYLRVVAGNDQMLAVGELDDETDLDLKTA